MEEDPFDAVQNLEEQYYREGYALGLADGIKAGHREGRFFGLEKGFEKFLEMGQLRGRSIVWSSRLRALTDRPEPCTPKTCNLSQFILKEKNETMNIVVRTSKKEAMKASEMTSSLPRFPYGLRLEKHLQTFHALTEPDSLDTHNNEDTVSHFDDRLKRAKAKARIVEKLIDEESVSTRNSLSDTNVDNTNIEDANILSVRYE